MKRILNISIIAGFLVSICLQNSLSQQLIIDGIDTYAIVKTGDIFQGKKSIDLNTSIDLGKYGIHILELSENKLISDDYILKTASEESDIREQQQPSIKTYIGNVKNDPNSVVALSVDQDFIHGFIRTEKSEINIEPMRYYHSDASMDDMMVYLTSSQKKKKPGICGLTGELERKFNAQVAAHKGSKSVAETCIEVDMAIASDYSLFEFYGSVAEVEKHAIAILNASQTNYDTEFNTEIKLNLVEQFVSDCDSCDPWTQSKDSESILSSFTTWSKSYWTADVDQSSFWTKRDISLKGNDAANGLAWVNTVCTNFSTLIVEDNDTGERKRVLFSHELGHNFGAQHDIEDGDFIMTSPLVETNQWSPTSQNKINTNSLNFKCLAECEPSINVVANFRYEVTGACVPLNVQFINQSEGEIDSVQWTFAGATPTFSSDLDPMVQYTSGGSYDVTLKVFGGDKTDLIEYRDLIIAGEAPDASFTFEIMDDNSVTLQVISPSDNTDYNWNLGDSTLLSGQEVSHLYTELVNQTVTLSASNECGSDESSLELNLEALILPVANFSSDIRSVCEGQNIQYFNLSESADSLVWFFQGGSPFSSSEENPTITYEQSGIYAVGLIAINSEGRDSVAVTGFIAVDPQPASLFEYTVTDKTVSFQNQSMSARSLMWDFGDGALSEEENPEHTYAVPGTYPVTLIVNNFCQADTLVQSITIEANLPIANFFTSAQNICVGESIRFEDRSDDAQEYMWEFEGAIPFTSTEVNPEVTYSSSGNYSVKLTVSNDDGENEIFLQDLIQVASAPDVNFSFIRSGKSVSFINSSANADTYSWDFGDGGSSTVAFARHTYERGGSYTIGLIATNECGSTEVTKQVEIEKTLPVAAFVPSARSVCAGSVIRYDNTSQEADAYQWVFEGGLPSISTIENPSIIYTTSGVYDVSLVVTNQDGQDTLRYSNYIEVESQPVINVSMESEAAALLIENNSLEVVDHLWNFGDGNTSAEATPTHQYESSGSFTITYQATNECGIRQYTEVIEIVIPVTTVDPADVAITDFMINTAQICLGGTIDIVNNSTEVDESFWSIKRTGTEDYQDFDPTVAMSEVGIYDLKLTVIRDTVETISIKESAVEVFASALADFTARRVGDSNTIEFSNLSSGATSYLWRFGNQFGSTSQNPRHNYANAEMYTVTLIAAGPCGNSSIEKQIDLTKIGSPQAIFSVSSLQICEGESIRFRSRSANAASHLWTFEGGEETSSIDADNEINYSTPGEYTVTYEVANINGTDKRTLTNLIKVLPRPTFDFDFTLTDRAAEFTFIGDSDLSDVSWNFGDGEVSTDLNPQHTYAQAGDYTVILTVNAACGRTTESKTVTVVSDAIQPTARFKISSLSTSEGGGIRFESISLDADRISWYFEGGDPIVSEEQIIRVIYEEAGKYDIRLTAYNEYGEHTVNLNDFVTVLSSALAQSETRSVDISSELIEDIMLDVSMYPNPFHDHISLEIDSYSNRPLSIEIFNITGQKVYAKQEIISSGHETILLDLDNLSEGTYIARIIQGDNTIRQKIVKQ